MIDFKIKVAFIVSYMMLGLFFILFFNKIFHKANYIKFKYLLSFFLIVYILVLIISIKYGRVKDSYFAIFPIISIIVFKISNHLFFKIFKEELINTANFFQYEMPILNSIWTHRVYNAIVINLSFTPIMYYFIMYNQLPSKQFIEIIYSKLASFF
jgi:hypothetical protein